MKKLLTIAFLLCSFLQAVADTWTDSNGIVWSFSIYNGNAVQVKPNDKSSITGDLVIPENMNSYPVKSIADQSFIDCNNLTSVIIPNNVTYIGASAFKGCKNLATITLPNSLVEIGGSAFYDCEKLGSLNLPGNLETIGGYAFCACKRLTTLTIPGSVETIGEEAFSGCNNVEDLTISEGVKSIGSGAFGGLKITSVNIPKSVTQLPSFSSLGYNPFFYCRSLETITVDADNPNYYSQNNSLIERSANTLVSASINTVIPNGIKIIGNSAFYGLPIETITIPNTVTTIGNSAFSNCEELISITIPGSVTKIDNYAFNYCHKIESIKLSSGLITIGQGAFWTNSNSLTSMIIPEGVTNIGSGAFQECYALKFVSLPSSLTGSLYSAFYGCNNLSEVEVNKTSPLNVDQYSFPNRTNATLYVPAGSKAAYQASDYWRDFENINEVGYIGDVNSELTGETGIACFVVNRTGKLGNYYVQAGTPKKVKIIGEVDANDLSNLHKDGYSYEMYYTTYLDISEAHINGCIYTDRRGTHNFLDNYFESDWMGAANSENDDDNWYGPQTIVLPITLEEFKGDVAMCRTLYSEQTTPFKTTITDSYYDTGKCKFYVPLGTRQSWIQKTTYPENVQFIDGPSKSVNVATAGTLATLLSNDEIESLNELSISGKINAKDFAVLKRMNNLVKLSVLARWEAYEGSEGPVEGQTSYRAGEVPACVFQNHSNLEDVRLSISYGQKGLLVGDYAFDGCTRLNKFTCEGFSSLGDFCFRNTKVNGEINLLGAKYYDYEDDEEKQCSDNREFEHIGRQPFSGVGLSSTSWIYPRFMCELFDGEGQMYGLYEMENFAVVPNYYSERDYFSGVTNKAKTLLHAMTTTKSYNLTLPSSITTLADYAVSGLQIRSINLNLVTTIGDAFLYQCPLLQSITCNNTAYKSVDGVLYTADKKTLVKYPCAKTAEELTIPSTVEQIGKWAFEGTQALSTITMETVTPPALVEGAFDDFNVTTITLNVPYGSKDAYMAANGWKDFNIVENVPEEVSLAVNSLGKGTYCSEFPLDFTNVSGIYAYIVSGFDPVSGNLIVTRVYEAPAGTGLYIVGTPGSTFVIPIKSTSFYYSNMMKGVTVATVIPANEDGYTNYVLSADGHGGVIFKLSNNASSPANRAYVQIPSSIVGARKHLGIETDDGSTTGLDGVFTPDTEEAEGDYYNLNGQKVQNLKRGIYIKNGKKIIIH